MLRAQPPGLFPGNIICREHLIHQLSDAHRVNDTWVVVQFEDRLKVAQLSRRKAELDLELAKSKLNVLRDYKNQE